MGRRGNLCRIWTDLHLVWGIQGTLPPAVCPSTFEFGSPPRTNYPVSLYLGSKVTLSASPRHLGELVASLVHHWKFQSPFLDWKHPESRPMGSCLLPQVQHSNGTLKNDYEGWIEIWLLMSRRAWGDQIMPPNPSRPVCSSPSLARPTPLGGQTKAGQCYETLVIHTNGRRHSSSILGRCYLSRLLNCLLPQLPHL